MNIEYAVTVAKLTEQLSKLPADAKVVILSCEENGNRFFEIDDVSLHAGEPSRDSAGTAIFKLEPSGPARWVFITASPA